MLTLIHHDIIVTTPNFHHPFTSQKIIFKLLDLIDRDDLKIVETNYKLAIHNAAKLDIEGRIEAAEGILRGLARASISE